MEANKKSPGRAKAKEEYLLSGKVFCGTCGGHMVGECGKSRNGTFYYYYKCINAKHGHTCKRKALKSFLKVGSVSLLSTPVGKQELAVLMLP